jgi:prevent-host-death family protein
MHVSYFAGAGNDHRHIRRGAKQVWQILDTAQREPVIITRHGRPAAYMISPQDMKEFQEARARSGQGRSARDRATASAQAWNEFDTKFGSFADEHSTL